jgi:hypothetical protein
LRHQPDDILVHLHFLDLVSFRQLILQVEASGKRAALQLSSFERVVFGFTVSLMSFLKSNPPSGRFIM